jgi:NitT/TauT family transport system ATP-binding protein
MARIEVHDVTKRFVARQGEVVALDRISLAVPAGELVSILGPSGCGKSTLLFIIAGLESPTEGEVRCGGRPVLGPGRERNVVFQEYALFPWRTVLGNVAIGLEGHLVRAEVEERARAYLDLVGLGGFALHYPHQLSGGMKQRVALARSLAMQPQVLLMDEPFAAVDAQTREGLQQELLRIWDQTRMTVLFVTHSIEEAVYLAQRVVVMTPRPGRVKALIDVDAGYPRTYDFRTSGLAGKLRTEIHDLLHAGADGEREPGQR